MFLAKNSLPFSTITVFTQFCIPFSSFEIGDKRTTFQRARGSNGKIVERVEFDSGICLLRSLRRLGEKISKAHKGGWKLLRRCSNVIIDSVNNKWSVHRVLEIFHRVSYRTTARENKINCSK